MTDLKTEIKQLIIDSLNLEDIAVGDIDDDVALFGDGLGLDSIDALELGLALQKRYDVKINAESEETRSHFATVDSLASFVTSHSAGQAV